MASTPPPTNPQDIYPPSLRERITALTPSSPHAQVCKVWTDLIFIYADLEHAKVTYTPSTQTNYLAFALSRLQEPFPGSPFFYIHVQGLSRQLSGFDVGWDRAEQRLMDDIEEDLDKKKKTGLGIGMGPSRWGAVAIGPYVQFYRYRADGTLFQLNYGGKRLFHVCHDHRLICEHIAVIRGHWMELAQRKEGFQCAFM